jgi:hypothetical protein
MITGETLSDALKSDLSQNLIFRGTCITYNRFHAPYSKPAYGVKGEWELLLFR